MKQEELEIKGEIGQAYRLGFFQKEYPFQFAKALTIGCSMTSIVLFITAICSIFEQKIIFIGIFCLLVLAISIKQLLRYQKMSLYLYSEGLYLFKRKDSQSSPHGQSIRWQQIERVYKSRIGLHLPLKNELGTLFLPFAFYRIDALYTTIERKVSLYNVPNE